MAPSSSPSTAPEWAPAHRATLDLLHAIGDVTAEQGGPARTRPRDSARMAIELRASRRRLQSWDAPERLDALGAAMPRRVADLDPVLCRELAQFAFALLDHDPARRPLPEDLDVLPPSSRRDWLRVAIAGAIDPEARARWIEPIPELELLRALEGEPCLAPHLLEPAILLEHLAGAADPRLRSVALDWLPAAVHDLALSTSEGLRLLEPLCADPDIRLRRRAHGLVTSLTFAVRDAAGEATFEAILRAGLEQLEDEPIRETCVRAAVRGDGHHAVLLLEIALEESFPAPVRASAFAGLGEVPGLGAVLSGAARPHPHEDEAEPALDLLALVVELGAEQPLDFGACARRHVLAAHRHGSFLRAAQIPALLSAFDHHPQWSAEELVRVSYIARKALITALGQLPADDPRWRRRAAILAASSGTSAHQLLARLLREVSRPELARAFVEAAGRSPEFDDEQALLAWLPVIPAASIPALKVKGGPASAEALLELAVSAGPPKAPRDPDTPLSPAPLEPVFPALLDALWALHDDRDALLERLCSELGPHAGGLFDERWRSTRDDRAAAVLVAAPWTTSRVDEEGKPRDCIEAEQALRVLCESGRRRFLPAIRTRYREVFRAHVLAALAGDFAVKRQRMPALEQQLYRYGRHLLADGRPVRRWIEDSPDTGRELVLALTLDWLEEQPQPDVPTRVALFETLARQQPTGHSLRRLIPHWRDPNPKIQRAAIEAIVAGGEEARDLELTLGRLCSAEDPRVLRQALAAVASLGATWAEDRVLAALDRPEMGVKQEAAAALSTLASARSLPALIDWLARHDNASLRVKLSAALDTAAGPARARHLVDAHALAPDERSRELLREALGGGLSVRALLRLARSARPADLALVEAALDGTLPLRKGSSRRALSAALHRVRLRAASPADEAVPARDGPLSQLELDGFSPERAAALLADFHRVQPRDLEAPRESDDARPRPPLPRSAVVEAMRRDFPSWLRWLEAAPDTTREANLSLLLEAAPRPLHDVHRERLLSTLERSAAVDKDAALARPVFDFVERVADTPELRARGRALIRATCPVATVPGLRRLGLLRALGAVLERADLDAALAACRLGPELGSTSVALLIDALALPPLVAEPPTPGPTDPPGARPKERERFGSTQAQALAAARDAVHRWHREGPERAAQTLDALLEAHPLGVPAPAPWTLPTAEAARPPARGRARFEALCAQAFDPASPELDHSQRARAARALLAWPEVATLEDCWSRLLALYLRGELLTPLQPSDAKALTLALSWAPWPWPEDEATRARVRALVPACDTLTLRRELPGWFAAWLEGVEGSDALLHAVPSALVLAEVHARAARGDLSLLPLLRSPEGLPARPLAALVECVAQTHPEAVAHLRPAPTPVHPQTLTEDPLAGLDGDIEGLAALTRAADLADGVAVRAVHALAECGAAGASPLEALATDRRPRVRSAAIRALRKVASPARTLDAIVASFAVETRKDVIISRLSSLGFARHEAGASLLLEHLEHGDPKVREGARRAVLGWGPAFAPRIHKMARKARPDRRAVYLELLERLEHGDD